MIENNTVNITIGKNKPDWLEGFIKSVIDDPSVKLNIVDSSEDESGDMRIAALSCCNIDDSATQHALSIRGDLLKHYSTGDPMAFIQLDHTGAPDSLSNSGMFGTETTELRHIKMPVRVQILADTPYKEAAQMLSELAEWLEQMSDEHFTAEATNACRKLEVPNNSTNEIPF